MLQCVIKMNILKHEMKSRRCNFDNRDDWTNIKEIKGVTLVCMPPFHFSTLKTKDED